MKLCELNVQELKKELEKRGLQTDGLKNKLILRLREAMESEDLDPENHEFEDDEIQTVEIVASDAGRDVGASSGNFDMTQLMVFLSGMNQKMDAMKQDMNQKMEQQTQRMGKEISQSNEGMKQELKQEIGEIKQSNQVMKQEMMGEIKQRLDEKFLDLSTTIDGKLEKLHTEIEDVQTEVELVKKEIHHVERRTKEGEQNLQRLEKELKDIKENGTSAQVIQTVKTVKLKPPTFDGTSSFGIFKLQFETASQTNGWVEKDRVAALIVALKAGAAETLQILPENDRMSYERIMLALERKYGVDHRHELYRMELKGRCQKVGETLQEFATDIERLVHLAHYNMVPEYTERIKIDAFTDGIRDPDIRRGVVLSPKVTFVETVACALINEAALNIVKPADKIPQIESEKPKFYNTASNNRPTNNWPTTKFRNGNGKIRCWICGRAGHIARDCWDRIKEKVRTASPMWRVPKEKERRMAERKEPSKVEELNTVALSGGSCQVDFKHRGRMEDNENVIGVRRMQVLPTGGWIKSEMRQEQLEDPDLSVIIKWMERKHRPAWSEIADKGPALKAYWSQWDSLSIEEGCLKRIWESSDGKTKQSLIVVPRIKIKEILKKCHGEAGSGCHLGVNGTLAKVRERFYWVGCRRSVENWCRRCKQCGKAKGPAKRTRELMQRNICEGTIRRMAVDHQTKARFDVQANRRGFAEGQFVWLHNWQRTKGFSGKLQPEGEGPYKVISRVNEVTYRIQRGLRGKPKVVHLERLALYRGGGLDPVRDEQVWAEGSVTN